MTNTTEGTDIPNYGDTFSLKEFVDAVMILAFVDDDGTGYYSNGKQMFRSSPAIPSAIRAGKVDSKFTHVVWFNK